MADVLPLEETLNQVKAHKLILAHNNQNKIDLWTPGRKMPMSLKRSVYKHRAELLNRMQSGDYRLCPNPGLHRRFWHDIADNHIKVCVKCLELEVNLNLL